MINSECRTEYVLQRGEGERGRGREGESGGGRGSVVWRLVYEVP